MLKEKAIKLLDSYYGLISTLASSVVTLSGGFMAFDITHLEHKHPRWIGLIDIVYNSLPTVFIISCIILFAATLGYQRWCKKSIKKLEAELDEAKQLNEVITDNIQNLFNGYLLELGSKKLGFSGNDKNTERVTLYIHGNNNKFIPFGRYSPNPKFNRPGRTEYPDDQGCISKAWEHGWCFENNLGDNFRSDSYIDISKNKYGINKQLIKEQLKMPSLLYAAKSIYHDGIPIAVIVVESTDRMRYEQYEIKQHLEEQECFIEQLIMKLKSHIPQPSIAKERGL